MPSTFEIHPDAIARLEMLRRSGEAKEVDGGFDSHRPELPFADEISDDESCQHLKRQVVQRHDVGEVKTKVWLGASAK